MMTTPRLVSLTALAASLFLVILTITQASGLTGTSVDPSNVGCMESPGAFGCEAAGATIQASFVR